MKQLWLDYKGCRGEALSLDDVSLGYIFHLMDEKPGVRLG